MDVIDALIEKSSWDSLKVKDFITLLQREAMKSGPYVGIGFHRKGAERAWKQWRATTGTLTN